MKQTIFFAIGLLLVLSGWVNAQNVPPPPTPVVESDLRDNNIKMRSIALERVKRDASKPFRYESTKERKIRFAKVKKDFEKIQRTQDFIVKIYTTGKTINYSRIGKSAKDISQSALRLDENLFGAKPEKTDKKQKAKKRKNVRDLIIKLDNAIGKFIKSPIFQNTKVVDSKVSREAKSDLEDIVRLSKMLSDEADRMK